MRSVVIPSKDDIDRAVNLVTTAACCVITVKLVSAAVSAIKQERQNRKIKQLKKTVDELEQRVNELEEKQLITE